MRSSINLSRESKADKRHSQILRQLQEKEKVRVSELSEQLDVTEETIRRDLEILEEQKQLIRVRGGAIPRQVEGFETPSLEREKKFLDEKKAMAKEAVKLVNEGEIIALDASTTSLQLAKALEDKPLTVITNSIHASIELAKKKAITVMLTGGYLRQESMSLVGFSSDKMINDYHIDTFFMSCTAVDSEWGVSDSHEMQAQTKKRIAELSEKIVLLVDHSKLEQKSLVRWLPLENIHTLITSASPSQQDLTPYKLKNLHTISVSKN
ncbi:DeoR/GlpR transcriptional regulator [Bacillus sp. A116_S68]|nr:DeoR/GlpR transcriptional regulator [Bacillus sp. A116_S68]